MKTERKTAKSEEPLLTKEVKEKKAGTIFKGKDKRRRGFAEKGRNRGKKKRSKYS